MCVYNLTQEIYILLHQLGCVLPLRGAVYLQSSRSKEKTTTESPQDLHRIVIAAGMEKGETDFIQAVSEVPKECEPLI